jgi:hypothetical protein
MHPEVVNHGPPRRAAGAGRHDPGHAHVAEVRAHAPVDAQRALDASLDPRGGGLVVVGADPDHDQDQVGGAAEVGLANDREPAVLIVDGFDDDVVDHLDGVAAELVAEQPAELDVDGRHDRRGLLDQRDCKAPAGEGLRHLQADIAAPDDAGRPGTGGECGW